MIPDFTVVTGGSAAADRGTAIVAGDGFIVIGGHTEGELEPGGKAGGKDIFIARYDAGRTADWVRQIGSAEDETLTAITRDDAGALYLVGNTYGLLGDAVYGKADIVIAKYDADGTRLWLKQIGSAEDDIALSCVAIGPALYVGGSTGGKLLPGESLPRREDGFIIEFDRDGAILRSTLVGSDKSDRVTALFAGGANTLYAAGTTEGALHDNLNYGNMDGFLSNFDLSLSRRWTRQFGTAGADGILAGAADAGGIALAGRTFGSFDEEINAGNYDALLLLFDLNGDRLFSRQHGNDGPDAFYGVAFAPDGSVVAAGSSSGAVFTQPTNGGYEIIAARYDRSGERIAALQHGTAGDDGAYAVAADNDGARATGLFSEEKGAVSGNYFIMDIKW